MKRPFYLIFDMDGVLVDNHQYHVKAWNEFCSRYHKHLSKEEFDRYVNGRTVTEVTTYLFGPETSKEKILEYSNEKEEIYRSFYRPHLKPVEGLLPFLQKCREDDIPTAVATSAPTINMDFTLDTLGLKQYFSVLKDSAGIEKGKPDPEIYLQTANALNAPPAGCVVFEDSLSGIRAGKAAGMKVVALITTHPAAELQESGADLLVRNFESVETKQLQNLVYQKK
ncbi:HAD family hydrolase [Nafulsella turpanensis]|uniref:HAD family hydrolase n=1 Tax=Nafulsella turpanensis TaxID=1265690 RepID=UPI00034D2F56|nr:HAD family phosphatase [Nafulsella turpanensis]